jgi:hypothetical protein
MATIINSRNLELDGASVRTTESTTTISASISGTTVPRNQTADFYKQLDNSILPATITLTADPQGLPSPVTFVWSYAADNVSPVSWNVLAGQTTNTISITNTNYLTYLGSGTSVVFKVECSKIGYVGSSATYTIYYKEESDESVQVLVDNPTINIPTNSLGTPINTDGTGTAISVYVDGTALYYGTSGPNTYSIGTISQSPISSITLGSGNPVDTKYVYSNIASITANAVIVTFPVTVRNRYGTAKPTVSVQQKFTKIISDSYIDTTPPPTPTNTVITAGFSSVFIKHDVPSYTAGKGHDLTLVYGVEVADNTVVKVFSDATNISQFSGSMGDFAAGTSKAWRIWLKWKSKDGYESTTPAGGSGGFYVKTTTIGNLDLGALVVEAGNLANNAVSADKLATNAVDATKFASGIEPVTVVSTVPATKSTNSIFNTTDGKMYRWNDTAYIATVPSTDLTGQLTSAQIADLAATKVTGQLTSAQIADLAATKVTGQLTSAQIADLAAAKLTGQITETQITDNAISAPKISAGAITAGKIAANAVTADEIASNSITAGKISAGAVTAGKIAANAVTADEIASNSITAGKISAGAVTAGKIAVDAVTANEIAANSITAGKISAGAVTAGKIAANAVTADEIASNSITAGKISAGAVTAGKIAVDAVTANEIAANSITAGKISAGAVTAGKIAANAVTADEIAANSITAGKIQAGAIGATQIAAGAVTTDKLLVTGVGTALNDDPNTQDITAWSGSGLSIITDNTSPAGNTVLRCAASAATVLSRSMALDPTKNYQLRMWTRQETGSSTTYLTVAFSDASGTNISGGSTGWGQGTYHYFGLIGNFLPSSWTEYRVSFGPGESFSIPSGAKYIKIGVLSNYSGTGTQLVTGVRLMLKADADLIVDGAIVAGKLAANSIAVGTAAIENGAIVNAMIGNLSADKITAGTLNAARIDANSITADKIDTKNLTIKDSAGTVIFSASQDLDYTRVGGTKPPSDADKTSLNTAAAIANQGSFATLSQITSGNAATYIGTAAIGSAYIADLDAGKINAGSLKVGSYIQSANYSTGSTGWRVASDGVAEFDSVVIRRNQRVAYGNILVGQRWGVGFDGNGNQVLPASPTTPITVIVDTGYPVASWFAADIKSTWVVIASPGEVSIPGGGLNGVFVWYWGNANVDYNAIGVVSTINDFAHHFRWNGSATIKFSITVSVTNVNPTYSGPGATTVSGLDLTYGVGWGLYKLT